MPWSKLGIHAALVAAVLASQWNTGCGSSAESLDREDSETTGAADLAADAPAFEGRATADRLAETPSEGLLSPLPETWGPDAEAQPPCVGDCLGFPCDSGEECPSGWCVDHMGNAVCTVTCVEECPPGWSCKQVAGPGRDVVFICVSNFTHLCRPCVDSADCVSYTGVEDQCLDYGPTGRFCGASCAEDTDCPVGFVCQEAASTTGAVGLQCVAASGECPCSDKAVKLGLKTVCSTANELGICLGERTCTAAGLTPCDAPAATPEECDGSDNDCDGETDEASCDDGNACTQDQCDAGAGCVNAALAGTDCSDENVCTLADHCVEGGCTGTPIQCDDHNPCTDDACVPTGGCLFTPNQLPCDDGDPCTVADECAAGKCGGFPVSCDCQQDSDCLAFDDGNACNGILFCDTAKLPHLCAVTPGSVVVCPEAEGADAVCQEPWCDPVSGDCSLVPANQGGPCEDVSACTLGDQCDGGACTPGIAANCEDSNECTDDWCDPAAGCLHADNELPCSDPNVCTVGDACVGGQCVPGQIMECDDGNQCTGDSCDKMLGCVHQHADGGCDDGNACTVGDYCAAGKCVGASMVDCSDADVCTTDKCDPLAGCTYSLNIAPCDDGNACTFEDHCALGECIASHWLTCSDGNPCTHDQCNPLAGCEFPPDQDPCDDGNACTQQDQCAGGKCKGVPVACNDVNLCTDDACDPDTGCKYLPNTDPCDDANACTDLDACAAGQCTGGIPTDCDDGNPCTDDSCDLAAGCIHVANDLPCEDGVACTVGDICADFACVPGPPASCDDSNPCTIDYCDQKVGCQHLPLTAGPGSCDDTDGCTDGDACAAGACVPGPALSCDDGEACTVDLCDPQAGCQHDTVDGPCDDGDPCTLGDTCVTGACKAGGPMPCDDGNPCSTDKCVGDQGCVHIFDVQPSENCWDVWGMFTQSAYAVKADQLQVFGKVVTNGLKVYAWLDGTQDDTHTTSVYGCGWYPPRPESWDIERKAETPDRYHLRVRGISDVDCGKGQPVSAGEIQVNAASKWKIVQVLQCNAAADNNSSGTVIPTWCTVDQAGGKISWQAGSVCGGCCACPDGASVDIDVVVTKAP